MLWFYCDVSVARYPTSLSSLALLVAAVIGPHWPAKAFETQAEGLQFFENRIRPLLVQHCYECHSQEGGKVKGGLLLDSRDGWMRGGDSGEVIVPGDVEASPLIEAIGYKNDDFQMPPKYRLAASEIDAIKTWVEGGAPDSRNENSPIADDRIIDIEAGRTFWAFQKPEKKAPPAVNNSDWPRTDLDRFLLADLESKGLTPTSPASREVLIRRATFDLTGLPPTTEDINVFVEDPADEETAFAKVVDRLLSSPQFGERWGRHWLDVVRYGESMGRTRNYPFPYAWRYRNYVIDAFNSDIPFDRFLTEQLAGDLLAHTDSAEENDRLNIATGFLALGSLDLNERDRKKFKMDRVDEQLDVSSRAFMAMTTGCARCHDHKFDPIPTKDYYALAGIFASSDSRMGYGNRQGGNKRQFVPEQYITLSCEPDHWEADPEPAKPRKSEELTDAKKRLKNLQRQLSAVKKEKGRRQRARQLATQIKRQQKKISRIESDGTGNSKPVPTNLAMGAVEAEKLVDCRVHVRGDVNKLGETVPRGFLQVINTTCATEIPKGSSGRLELAEWLTHSDHPLTARVFVNRAWHHLFGHGIVRTVDNFGVTGARPTNPDLLDYLALRFIAQNWSIKSFVREVVLSRAYQMSSDHDESNWAIDPDNNTFWKMNLRRLEVEAIRDAMFAVSGRLDLARPQGSPLMSVPIGELRRSATNVSRLAASNLRSVYLPVVRGYLPQVFEVFDFAEPSQVIGRRDITTVSPQALYFMNNPEVIDHARAVARTISKKDHLNDTQKLQHLYRASLGRNAEEDEVSRGLSYVHAAGPPVDGWAGMQQILYASAEFRYLR